MRLYDFAEMLEAEIISRGARPAFPVNLSINNEAAHYSPKINDSKVFSKGDVVKIDLGAHIDGYIADTAVTVIVGERNPELERLIQAAEEALERAVMVIGPGTMLRDLGGVIEDTIVGYGYKPVVNLSGHQIDRWNLHAGLSINNYRAGAGKIPEEGVFAIEPFAVLRGSGVVREGPPGGIYRAIRNVPIRDRVARDLFEFIKENFGTLPFSERWCLRYGDESTVRRGLLVLQRMGAIMQYRVLKDTPGSFVSQAEHTVVIRKGEKYVITAEEI